jgi:O-antigen ligase/tetratricopeptide (TPR) repeat protein
MSRPALLGSGLLLLWAGSLLAFGAPRPAQVAWVAGGAALLFGASLVLLREPLRLSRAALAFLGGFVALFALQLLPLPFLFPFTSRLREAHGVGLLWPGTADAARTVAFIGQFAAAALSGLLVLRLRQNGLSSAWVLRGALAVLGLEAAFGVVRLFAGWPSPPFYEGPSSGPDSASGTLVNRNSFAGLMGMGLVVATALAVSRFTWPARRPGEDARPPLGRRLESGLGWALAAGLFAVALVLSKSRGGVLAALAGILLLPFFHRGRSSLGGVAALCGVGVLAVLAANPAGLLARFGQIDPFDVTAQDRWEIWTSTSAAALRQPVLGFGAGSHPDAFHPFQPPELPGQVHHAHSEYVNLLFETGFAGLGLALAALGTWYVRVFRALRAVPGPDRLPLASALGAVSVTAVHSLVDFDLRITSIGLLFGAMLGLGASVSRRGEPRPRAAWMAVVDGLAVAAALAFVPFGRGLGIAPYDHREAWRRAEAEGSDRRLMIAADLWPAQADLQREAALRLVERDPGLASRFFHRLFAQQPGAVGPVMDEIAEPSTPTADLEKLVPLKAAPELAAWLVRRGRWEEAGGVFDRSGSSDPAAFDRFADALSSAGQWGLETRLRERRLALRTDGAGCAAAARAWSRLGVHDRAVDRARTAAGIEPRDAAWALLEADCRRAAGDSKGALESLTEAIRRTGSDASLRRARASLASALRMPALEAEDYRELLRVSPGDRGLTLALARALLASGDATSSRTLLDAWLRQHPDDAEAKGLLERK